MNSSDTNVALLEVVAEHLGADLLPFPARPIPK